MTTRSDQTTESEADDFGARLEAVFQGAHGELLGTLYYVVGNLEGARDALQETFLKCWRYRGQREEIIDLKAWVYRVALNTGRDLRRTAWNRRRKPLAEDVPMLSNPPGPETAMLHNEQLELPSHMQSSRPAQRIPSCVKTCPMLHRIGQTTLPQGS